MFCTVGFGGQQTQKRHVGYQRSNSWRRALSWLWKPAIPTVCCRVEEVSAPCECVRCWGMQTCATAWPMRATEDGGKSPESLLHPCNGIRASAQFMHCLPFLYGTVHRNCPEQVFSRWVKGRVQPQDRLVWTLLTILRNRMSGNVGLYFEWDFSVSMPLCHRKSSSEI